MTNYVNPFEYEAASKLTSEQLVAYYSEDFNYSRFVESKKNIFLVGERGTGKTMALLYHSLPVKKRRAQKEKQKLDLSMISVYVPCNTPLFHRQEHDLLDHLHASLVSEHCLVVSIMREVVETVSGIKELFDSSKVEAVRDEIAYVLSLKLPDTPDLFRALSLAFDKSITTVQKVLNEKSIVEFYTIEIVTAKANGIYVTGLPETVKIIVAGQGFVSVGDKVKYVLVDDPKNEKNQ